MGSAYYVLQTYILGPVPRVHKFSFQLEDCRAKATQEQFQVLVQKQSSFVSMGSSVNDVNTEVERRADPKADQGTDLLIECGTDKEGGG